MKAIRIHDYGGPEVLSYEDAPVPEIKPDQALVRVHYAGVNFADIQERRGHYRLPSLPATLGREAAGIVEKVGPAVEGIKPGDRVAFKAVPGSYAEYVAAPALELIPLPPDIDFQVGAALPLQGMTAHYLLTSLHQTRPGETVLVHAAAGGVGQLAVQIAKILGARVIGTVSTRQKAEIARSVGADEVVLYAQEDFVAETRRLTGGQGADVVLDGVGKATFAKSMEAARVRGHVVIFGASSGPADPIAPNTLQGRALTISGGSLPRFTATREELLWRAREVFGWYQAGKLRVNIDRVLPLAEAAEAHRLLEGRQTAGKLLLAVTQ